MSSNIWFIADTHFFHSKIIEYCHRPFSNAREMNDVISSNWCSTVKPQDIVYHLGDVSFGKEVETDGLLSKLPGSKRLVRGNHDHLDCLRKHFTMNPEFRGMLGATYAHMYHYPVESWDRRYHGSIHIHGHIHSQSGDKSVIPNRFDVGVDANEFTPVSLDYLLANTYSKKGLQELEEQQRQQGSQAPGNSQDDSPAKE